MDLRTCLQTTLKNRYQKLNEAYSGKSLLPLRICYRTLKDNHQLNNLQQHEFRYVDKSDLHSWVRFKTVPLEDVLSCDCKHQWTKRTVITLGVSGVGKTTTVQTCALEWAEGKGYHNIHLLFLLTFWELNLINQQMSLIKLLETFYPGLKKLDSSTLKKSNVWFVLDGLDEFNFQLNFNCPAVRDVSEVARVDILVTNLIRGNLLPKAHIWITTRHATATIIPDCYLLKETEVQGFSCEQKEEHFRTIVGDDNLASKAINHVRISRSLDFLCQIPPICSIMATVLKDHVKAADGYKIKPLNLTQIYCSLFKTSNPDTVAKLKQLPLLTLVDRSVIYKGDLQKSDLSVHEASEFAKECPLVLRAEKGLHNTTVFRFCHSSILEFLAASAKLDAIDTCAPSFCCHELVNQALQSPEGRFDVFLRFVFGLLKERSILPPCDRLFYFTRQLILGNILNVSAVGLFHCLREYDSQALLWEVRSFQKSGISPFPGFEPVLWQFMIQRSTNFEGMQITFKMALSERCDENLLKQIPHVLKSKKAMLQFSNLTDDSCPALAAILSTQESYLRELDLGYNSISDSGVKTLVEGLSDPSCRLKKLRLQGCEVTSLGCKYLAGALRQSQKLLELDLSGNEIGSVGIQHLANGLACAECRIETLKLIECNIETNGCCHLASALQKNPSHLRALDLSINTVGDQGARELFKILNTMKLTQLDMCHCGLTMLSCRSISKALMFEHSTLEDLNLSNNDLTDKGFSYICDGMAMWCSLKKLNVSNCGITDIACRFLATVIWERDTDWQAVQLTDIDLSRNSLKDAGVRHISAGLTSPYSSLKTLNLSYCDLTDDCCAELASGFAAEESVLSEVDLSGNNLHDQGMEKLCVGLRNPHCHLEKLELRSCGLSSRSIQFLISALKSNPRHLAELHLMGNHLEESGIDVLLDLTKNKRYTLHTLDFAATQPSPETFYRLPPYFSKE